MKKNVLILAAAIMFSSYVKSQPDTNIYQTSTSQNVATWLKNLSVPTGNGHVSISDWQMGGVLLNRHYVDSLGVMAYYQNTNLFHNDLNIAGQNMRRDFRKMQQAGATMARCPALIPWGVVEPSQGTYHYEFIDSTVKIASVFGVKLLGTVIPLADWSQTCNPVNNNCNILTGGDFYFLNSGKTGPVCPADTSYFYQFVQQTVERYDGDGVNDMPGLTQPITFWEFSSEPESPCGNDSASNYERDLDIFKRAMKASCPTCQLINGGWAGFLQDSSYWKTVIQDKHTDIDIGNIHCNEGRSVSPFIFSNMIYKQTKIFQEKINQLSLSWNIWLTEWGIYCGQPTGMAIRTEEEEASLYAKIYCWCLANNVTNIFYDLKTMSNPQIGSASLLQEIQGPQDSLYARLFFYTQKLLEYKFRTYDSVRVIQFDTSTSFSYGDVRFYKSGIPYYVLWGLNNLPPGLNGVKQITDIYGNISSADVSTLTLPLGHNPVIIENTVATALNEFSPDDWQINIYPNPATDEIKVSGNQSTVIGIEIYNLTGEKIYHSLITDHRLPITLNVSDIPAGMYFVKIKNEKGVAVKKFIKE